MSHINIGANGVSVSSATTTSGSTIIVAQLDLTDCQIKDAVEEMLGKMPVEQASKFLRQSFPELFEAPTLVEQKSYEHIGEVVIGEEGTVKGWTVVRWRADLPPVAVGTKLYAAPVSPTPAVNADDDDDPWLSGDDMMGASG